MEQNIYLDNAGAGAGSEADPYGAFSEINWTTGGANSIFDWVAAGDDVYINLKKGVTWSELLTVGTSGVSGHPITIQAYSSGVDPIITGGAARARCISISSIDYITVDEIRFTNATSQNVYMDDGSDHIIIQNCEIDNSADKGVAFNWDTGDNNIIQDCNIYSNGWGIHAYIYSACTSGNETIIRRNNIYSNSKDGIHIRAHYWIVEYNRVYNNGSANAYVGIHVYSELAENSGNNNIIRYNRVYGQTGNGQDGAGIAVDHYCDNNQIYGNVCYDNDGPGVYLYDADGCKIYSNTCYDNCQNSSGQLTQKGEIRLTSSGSDLCDNFEVKNNIAQATQADTYAIYLDAGTHNNTFSITHNDWYASAANWYFWNASGGNALATWNAFTGVGTDLNSDPLFTNAASDDFTLQAGSPARSGGVAIAGYNDRIVPGSSWPDNVSTMTFPGSIGAYGFLDIRTPFTGFGFF